MEIRMFLPSHCSGLKLLPTRCTNDLSSMNLVRRKRTLDNDNYLSKNDSRTYALIIQCSRDRILWNVIQPWMEVRDTAVIMTAVRLLLKQFQQFLFLISPNDINYFENILENESVKIQDQVDENDGHSEENGLWSGIRIRKTCSTSFVSNEKARMEQHKLALIKRRRMLKRQFNIFFIPPYPSPSTQSTLYTEKLFTRALVKLENMQIRLQSLNAYVATLGGGYFLCRYLSTAISLANYQRKLALALGDYSLAMKCTVNEAYNYIHAGMISHANFLIQKTRKHAVKTKDDLVLSMCQSATWFSDRVAEAMLCDWGNDVGGCSSGERAFSSTVDDFQRIRVVRDRNTFKKKLFKL